MTTATFYPTDEATHKDTLSLLSILIEYEVGFSRDADTGAIEVNDTWHGEDAMLWIGCNAEIIL